MSFWCPLLTTSLAIHHSNVGVQLRRVTTSGQRTLLSFGCSFAGPHSYTAGGSREGGSENYSERTGVESKWGKEFMSVEKKKRKASDLQAFVMF